MSQCVLHNTNLLCCTFMYIIANLCWPFHWSPTVHVQIKKIKSFDVTFAPLFRFSCSIMDKNHFTDFDSGRLSIAIRKVLYVYERTTMKYCSHLKSVILWIYKCELILHPFWKNWKYFTAFPNFCLDSPPSPRQMF